MNTKELMEKLETLSMEAEIVITDISGAPEMERTPTGEVFYSLVDKKEIVEILTTISFPTQNKEEKMNLTVRKRDEKGRYLSNYAPDKKPGRKAIVRYRRTADDQNMIVALEGFLSDHEIDGIGGEVSRIWRNSEHRMYWFEGHVYISAHSIHVLIGNSYNHAAFNHIIAEMKTCGKVLSRIIKDVRAAELAEIKVIEI